VCAVLDGAEWSDGFLDWQRRDALQVLDGTHAAQDVHAIGQRARAAGSVLPGDWLQRQRHSLAHQGPTAVLCEVHSLRDSHPDGEERGTKGASLETREARLQYPPSHTNH
jgi:hypothetical protein